MIYTRKTGKQHNCLPTHLELHRFWSSNAQPWLAWCGQDVIESHSAESFSVANFEKKTSATAIFMKWIVSPLTVLAIIEWPLTPMAVSRKHFSHLDVLKGCRWCGYWWCRLEINVGLGTWTWRSNASKCMLIFASFGMLFVRGFRPQKHLGGILLESYVLGLFLYVFIHGAVLPNSLQWSQPCTSSLQTKEAQNMFWFFPQKNFG